MRNNLGNDSFPSYHLSKATGDKYSLLILSGFREKYSLSDLGYQLYIYKIKKKIETKQKQKSLLFQKHKSNRVSVLEEKNRFFSLLIISRIKPEIICLFTVSIIIKQINVPIWKLGYSRSEVRRSSFWSLVPFTLLKSTEDLKKAFICVGYIY